MKGRKKMKRKTAFLGTFIIVLLTFTTVFSALADDNILNTNWVGGGDSLTVTQGEDATLHLEILSAGNNVYLQVRL